MNQQEFKKVLSSIETAISSTGKIYTHVRVVSDYVEFVRNNNKAMERIPIQELYDLYSKERHFNTVIAKKYISGRVQSPAVAILISLKTQLMTLDRTDDGMIENEICSKADERRRRGSTTKINDETKFFVAFSELVGANHLWSKSIGKPVNSSHLFLSKNYEDYLFDKNVNSLYLAILKALRSSGCFQSVSLAHFVDGVIIKHPELKTRIVEFDEEQHFTPARMDTLKLLVNISTSDYIIKHFKICSDLQYLNDAVLDKHRIKNRLKASPNSFEEFESWLKTSQEKLSNYICSTNNFEYLGGRIAKRAYYDTLRDTAHLSGRNPGLHSALRFAKKEFEDIEKISFSKISISKIKEIVKGILKNQYKIKI